MHLPTLAALLLAAATGIHAAPVESTNAITVREATSMTTLENALEMIKRQDESDVPPGLNDGSSDDDEDEGGENPGVDSDDEDEGGEDSGVDSDDEDEGEDSGDDGEAREDVNKIVDGTGLTEGEIDAGETEISSFLGKIGV